MECKRLCLLNKLACEVLEWPDKNLMRELASGFRLVGEAPATGVFSSAAQTGAHQ
jgi:hypothetical protein